MCGAFWLRYSAAVGIGSGNRAGSLCVARRLKIWQRIAFDFPDAPGRLSDERNQYFSTNFREHFPNFWKKNSPSPRQPTWHSKLISFPLISLCKRGPMLRSPLKLWSSKSWQWLSHFSFSSFSSFLNKLPFHFIPFHFFSFPWSRYNKEKKNFPKIWRPKVLKPLSHQNTRKKPNLGQNFRNFPRSLKLTLRKFLETLT